MPLLERGVVFIVYHTNDHVGVKKENCGRPHNHHEGGTGTNLLYRLCGLEAEGHICESSRKVDPPVWGGHY